MMIHINGNYDDFDNSDGDDHEDDGDENGNDHESMTMTSSH